MMTPREKDQDLVETLLDVEEGLSESALTFIDKMDKWLRSHETLTDPQRAATNRILTEWNEKT